MRRHDLFEDLITVVTPRRPWPDRGGARSDTSPGGRPASWLAALALLALGSLALAVV